MNEEAKNKQKEYQSLWNRKEELEQEVVDWKQRDEERIGLQQHFEEVIQQQERKKKEIDLLV